MVRARFFPPSTCTTHAPTSACAAGKNIVFRDRPKTCQTNPPRALRAILYPLSTILPPPLRVLRASAVKCPRSTENPWSLPDEHRPHPHPHRPVPRDLRRRGDQRLVLDHLRPPRLRPPRHARRPQARPGLHAPHGGRPLHRRPRRAPPLRPRPHPPPPPGRKPGGRLVQKLRGSRADA